MTMASPLKQRIQKDVTDTMRAKDKPRLGTLRLVTAAIKQIEVDTRSELDDAAVLGVLDKMVKQRRESIKMYDEAKRQDLADIEHAEIAVLQTFLPAQLTSEEIDALISDAITKTGAQSMKDMGKVMGMLKPQLQGRADMGPVSGKIKAQLG